MGRLTTHDVLKRCGITSAKTLTRWHQRKLVPPPVIETHPNGRGKIAYWPSWVEYRIREVKAGIAAGKSLDELARALGTDWKAEEKRWLRKKPDLKAELDRMNRHEAVDAFAFEFAKTVYDHLHAIGVQRPGSIYDRVWKEIANPPLVDEILRLMKAGFAPVVVICEGDMKVVPDLLLAALVGDATPSERPLLIVPVREIFLEAFAEAEPDLPKQSSISPVLRVLDRSEKISRERSFKRKGDWGFVIGDK